MRSWRQGQISKHRQSFTARTAPHWLISDQRYPIDQLNRRQNFGGLQSGGKAISRLAPSNHVTRFTSETSRMSPLPARLPASPVAALQQVTQEFRLIKNSNSVPSDESVIRLLQKCYQIAQNLSQREHEHGIHGREDGISATSSLLGLEEKKPSIQRSKETQSTGRWVSQSISYIINELLQDEKVFISPRTLEYYTKIQTQLKNADYFPLIFSLYANKLIPKSGSLPVKYRQQNPRSVKNAIPTELANMALDLAIEQRNLSLVLAIIDATFCAPAFHGAKIFKKAALPLTGLAAAPVASYAAASWMATFQNTMDPSTATGIAFAAILAYVGFTSSVGVMAVATVNDHMQRVVWTPGIPLRQRWLREEERMALDKVAVAWGFKDPRMRGEEEGEEWESLREFVGMRGMILDKTELMEGMQ